MSSSLPPQLQQAVEDLLTKAAQLEGDPSRFSVYATDPIGFASDILGFSVWSPDNPDIPGITPKQQDLLKAVANGDTRIAVRSGHGTGKSFVLALLVVWWLYAKRGLVVTTASTWDQVERVLWREIAGMVRKSKIRLPGELLQTELRVAGDWYAVGLSTNNPTAFQGHHHRHLLVVVDEAPGVDELIHQAIASLATGEQNVIVMVGNPTEAAGTFYEAFNKPQLGWNRMHMNCLDHPNVVLGREIIPGAVTRKWVEEAKVKWGETSPIYASRVLGNFPDSAVNAVCPMSWVDRAMQVEPYEAAKAVLKPTEHVVIAADIARYGDNKTVMAIRRGKVITEIHAWEHVDTMETTGRIARKARELNAQLVVVDEVGLGAGPLDRLVEIGINAVGFHSGRPASHSTLFQNRRGELWWRMREALEQQAILLPQHDQLRADLVAPTYKVSSNGKVQVERKEDLRARGIPSPDFADAVIMTLAVDGEDAELPPPEDPWTEGRDRVWETSPDVNDLDNGPLGQLPAGC